MPDVIYTRFSDRPGAAECESCERQLDEMRRWCGERARPIKSEHADDARSGGDRSRPGLFDAVAACEKGDTLLVYSWDRFARDNPHAVLLLDDLEKRGVEVRSMSEQGDMPMSSEMRLMRGLRLLLAQYEREKIAAVTRASMRWHSAQGRCMGGYRYGLRPVADPEGKHTKRGALRRRLVANVEELKAIQRIRELRDRGMGYRAIARQLDKERYPCRGECWQHTLIRRLLLTP